MKEEDIKELLEDIGISFPEDAPSWARELAETLIKKGWTKI